MEEDQELDHLKRFKIEWLQKNKLLKVITGMDSYGWLGQTH